MTNVQASSYGKPVTLGNVLRFALPTMIMTIFTTFYTMVDGLFVSNLISTNALSAINLTAPLIGLITAISGMLATGGSAVVMTKMGEGRENEAREDFTLLILTNVVVGAIMMLLGFCFMDQLLAMMQLSDEVLSFCRLYLSRYLIFTIPILLMYNFSLYLIAADKSRLSLICSIAGGITNIVLDYLFIAILDLGIAGAAIATGLGYSITALAGMWVFAHRQCLLHFCKPAWRSRTLLKSASNGLSEMATALVSGITTLLFNLAMLRYIGENGVAAITIIMYVLMFASALFIGYSYGIAPTLSFYYGQGDQAKLSKLVKISLAFVGIVSIGCTALSISLTEPLVGIFVRSQDPVYALAVTGNKLCSLALLFLGFNVLASGLFTALSNGIVSAVLALSRSFIFTVAAITLLPIFLGGVTGVWLATPCAELMGLTMSIFCFLRYRKRYGYFA